MYKFAEGRIMHFSILFNIVVFCSFLIPTSAFSQTISGNISSPDGNVGGSEIVVVDSAGSWIDNTFVDGSGNYSLTVLICIQKCTTNPPYLHPILPHV